jgi:hypothetical protein
MTTAINPVFGLYRPHTPEREDWHIERVLKEEHRYMRLPVPESVARVNRFVEAWPEVATRIRMDAQTDIALLPIHRQTDLPGPIQAAIDWRSIAESHVMARTPETFHAIPDAMALWPRTNTAGADAHTRERQVHARSIASSGNIYLTVVIV